MLKAFSCGMVHQGISRRVLRGTLVIEPSIFCGRGFGLVVSVIVPLVLAVLPYMRVRLPVSNSIVWTNLCLSSFISYYIKYSLQTTTTTPQLLKLLKYGSFPQDGARKARGLESLDGHAHEAKGLVSLIRTPLGLRNSVLRWEVSWLQRSNLGLAMSSWQRCQGKFHYKFSFG
jgi:hypothetical protein